MFHLLEIRSFVVGVNLGLGAEERANVQEVSFSAQIRFHTKPKACENDEIQDSVDYAALCQAMGDIARSREFKMIEHLAHQVFLKIKPMVGSVGDLRLEVHKLHPPVENLRGGSVFTLGDF